MTCKICNSKTSTVFADKVNILQKYPIDYHRCDSCGFIQTDDPFWLPEAYNSAITSLDIGLVGRNIKTSKLLSSLIIGMFDGKGSFIDYGGGYGMLVRIMRDLGFNFYRFDTYCENLFSKHFDLEDTSKSKFDLLTAFEVYEHLLDPISETKKMLELSDSIFFSTELVPDRQFKSTDDWWYFAPETGQHIALYSAKSLSVLADQLGCNYYTNGRTLHLITKRKFSQAYFDLLLNNKVALALNKLFRQQSLLKSDFDNIRKMIHQA